MRFCEFAWDDQKAANEYGRHIPSAYRTSVFLKNSSPHSATGCPHAQPGSHRLAADGRRSSEGQHPVVGPFDFGCGWLLVPRHWTLDVGSGAAGSSAPCVFRLRGPDRLSKVAPPKHRSLSTRPNFWSSLPFVIST